jgi:hypothetical protein
VLFEEDVTSNNLGIQRFYKRAQSHIANANDLPDFFVYYITVEQGESVASTRAISDCYDACDLAVPSWLASNMSKGLSGRAKRFVKRDGGYRLEQRRRSELAGLLGGNEPALQIGAALSRLETRVPAGPKRDFLHETINCFGVAAYRASVVMCWNLALHHLQDYVLSDNARLATFNSALGNNKDGRVKIKVISKQDDFTEMPESKFLLFCREAKLITSTIYKKFEVRLDERNSAAHPSGVTITPKAAEAYIEDMVENVLLKYNT